MKLTSKKFNDKNHVNLNVIGLCFVVQDEDKINDDHILINDIYYNDYKEIIEKNKEEFEDLILVDDMSDVFTKYSKENKDLEYRVFGSYENFEDQITEDKKSLCISILCDEDQEKIMMNGAEEEKIEVQNEIRKIRESKFKKRFEVDNG